MASEWRTVPLGEIYDFSSGLSKPRSAFGSGYPFLSFKDVFYNSAVPEQLRELVQSTEQERVRCSIKRGDVFLTRTSETMDELGMSSVALFDVPDATFNGFTKRLRAKRDLIAPEFARYYFRGPGFRAAVNSMASMSTRASLNNEMLGRLTITFPEYEEQEAIGHILGTLDDKIELNRKQNETLEAMARALFKAWFVDFELVRAKMEGRWQRGQSLPGLPANLYDLFPGRLVESELGEIPEGWEMCSLDSIANYLNGLALQKFPPESEEEFLPVIKIAQLRAGNTNGADRASARIRPEYVVADGDVLFSWSGSLEVEVWNGGPGALNQHLFKVTSDKVPKWFYFFATRHHLPAFRAIAAGKATTMGHIQRKHLTDARIAVAPQERMQEFDAVIAPLFEQFVRNYQQSRTLAQLRDTLLPKLISGELRVSDAEGIVVGAAP